MTRLRSSTRGYLTPQEVADLLMVSPITVRQWAQKGWLDAQTTPGGHRRFMWRDVEQFARDRGLTLYQGDDGLFKILVVDADPQFAAFVRDRIGMLDRSIEVEVASSAFDAGQKVRAFKPRVILLDLMMDGMDGLAVCRQIKSDPVTRGIDVVGVAAFHSPEKEALCVAAGARSCITKPVDIATLADALGIRQDAAVGQ